MTLDEAIEAVFESLVADGIFVRTDRHDADGNPLYELAPELRHLSEAALALLVEQKTKGLA